MKVTHCKLQILLVPYIVPFTTSIEKKDLEGFIKISIGLDIIISLFSFPDFFFELLPFIAMLEVKRTRGKSIIIMQEQ